MNNSLNLAKYRRLAKIMQIVIRVFLGVCIVIVIAAMAAGSIVTFIPSTILSGTPSGNISLSLDNIVMFKLSSIYASAENTRLVFASFYFTIAAAAIILTVLFRQLELILGTVKNNNPFDPKNSRRLSIMGAALMIGAIVIRVGEYIVYSTIIHSLKQPDISVNFSADSNMIIIGFVVLILAGVFKYGSYLQKEYDSTI